MIEPLPIAAIGNHGVECVDDRDDARAQWNFFGLEAAGISTPVEGFMMMQSEEAGFFQSREQAQNRPAIFRMLIHDGALFVSELARLFQNDVGNADFADVVQQRRYFILIEALFLYTEPSRNAYRPLRQSGAMHAGIQIF